MTRNRLFEFHSGSRKVTEHHQDVTTPSSFLAQKQGWRGGGGGGSGGLRGGERGEGGGERL